MHNGVDFTSVSPWRNQAFAFAEDGPTVEHQANSQSVSQSAHKITTRTAPQLQHNIDALAPFWADVKRVCVCVCLPPGAEGFSFDCSWRISAAGAAATGFRGRSSNGRCVAPFTQVCSFGWHYPDGICGRGGRLALPGGHSSVFGTFTFQNHNHHNHNNNNNNRFFSRICLQLSIWCELFALHSNLSTSLLGLLLTFGF